jgi:hypothetical protein
MGRYDILTKLEEPTQTPPPSPAHMPPTKKQPQMQTNPPETPPAKKPEIMKTRKPESFSPTSERTDKPEKYSTLLLPNLIRKIKLHAAQQDIKDYEVLEIALTEYFEKHS